MSDIIYYQFFSDKTCDDGLSYQSTERIGDCYFNSDSQSYVMYQWITPYQQVRYGEYAYYDSTCSVVQQYFDYDLDTCTIFGGIQGSEVVSMDAYAELYYQYFEGDGLCTSNQCEAQTTYIINRCFETQDDNDNWVMARATWAPNEASQQAQIAFYDWNDPYCVGAVRESFNYSLDECVGIDDYSSESLSSNYMMACNNGMPWWVVLLIVLGSVCLCCACFGCCRKKKKPPSTYQPVPPATANTAYGQAAAPAAVYAQPVQPQYTPNPQQYAQPQAQQVYAPAQAPQQYGAPQAPSQPYQRPAYAQQ
jgi:hypothetical protein